MKNLDFNNFLQLSGEDLEEFNRAHGLSFLPGETAIAQEYLKSQLSRYEKEGTTVDRDMIQLSLEVNGQSWCEHSAHGTINGRVVLRDYSGEELREITYERLLDDTIMQATRKLNKPHVVNPFKDDSSVIYFVTHNGVRYGFAGKCESHNYPSGVGPFGGSNTCTGGVYRDIWSALADLRMGTFILILPDPDTPRELIGDDRKSPMVYMTEINRGNQDYGNNSGNPTGYAFTQFSRNNANNPLVFGGAFGLVDMDYYESTIRESVKPGDVMILVGGRTGRDGIHGATLSSIGRKATEKVEDVIAGVQIGNPIEEQSWAYHAVEELFPKRLIKYSQDFGGGGLSSVAFETAKKTGGVDVYIGNVRTKEEGMTNTEKVISESQERQCFVIDQSNVDEVCKIFSDHGIEAYPFGVLTDSGRARVYDNQESKRTLMDMDLSFLHGGKPKVVRNATFHVKNLPEPKIEVDSDLRPELKKVLASYNVCSNEESQVRIFDHQVQGGTVLPQFTGPKYDSPNDAVVYRPIPGCNAGWVITVETDARKTLKHAGLGVRAIFDSTIRKNVTHGGNPDRMTIFDNWAMANCKGDDEELGRLAVALESFTDCIYEYDMPCDVGKDSMNNHYEDRRTGKLYYIAPTLIAHTRSVVDDVRTAVSGFAKKRGNHLYLLGDTKPELGGSVFYWIQDGSGEKEPLAGWDYYHINGYVGNEIPVIDGEMAGKMYRDLHKAVTKGILPKEKIIRASKAVTHGGLGVTATQMAYGGRQGMELYLSEIPGEGDMEDWQALFSESLGRVLLEVPPEKTTEFEDILGEYPFARIGTITGDPYLKIFGKGNKPVVYGTVEELGEAWKSTMRGW